MRDALPRSVHPAAWWLWAIALCIAASSTTNPLLLGMLLGSICLVVALRRSNTIWSRAFRFYLLFGVIIVIFRIVLHIIVGLKTGEIELVRLGQVTLPSWAAGIELFGTIYLESLLAAALQGLRLAIMVIAIGAANSLADPKRLLRALPGALYEIGTAIVVAVSVAPQMAQSVARVNRARVLRGDSRRGIRALPRIVAPVLHDTLDQSLSLAASMDSRGYGRHTGVPAVRRRLTAVINFAALVGICVGIYHLLDPLSTGPLGQWLLIAGLALAVLGLLTGGRDVRRTKYRPDRWRLAEIIVVAAGAGCAAAFLWQVDAGPMEMTMPLQPLGYPTLPLIPLLGIVLALLPGVLTPAPPQTLARPPAAPVKVAA